MKTMKFKQNGMTAQVMPVEILLEGKEDGIVHIEETGSLGNTIASEHPKSNSNRYGFSIQSAIGNGWLPFVYISE